MSVRRSIYGGLAPIDAPAYTPVTAAHHLGLPATTVRYWVLGRDRHRPVIKIADPAAGLLSFRNLVEVHVLGAVRRAHRVALPEIRRAVEYLARDFGSAHPLSDEDMSTDGKHLFVQKFGKLINASREGQVAMEKLIEAHLKRIERDRSGTIARLFPFTRARPEGPKSVVINPLVQFGRPCLTGTGIPTSVIAQRFKAGEEIASLAHDYSRAASELEEAIRYEAEIAPAA